MYTRRPPTFGMRSMRLKLHYPLVTLAVCVVIGMTFVAYGQSRKRANRAKLPTFDATKTNRIFFPDVFARLDGERPENPNVRIVQAPVGGSPGEEAAAQSYAWSKIISGSTIEDEVKAIKLATDKNWSLVHS